MELPPLYSCQLCGTRIEPNDPMTWRRVSGWVQNKKPNAIALPEGEMGFACHVCVETARHKRPNEGQEALF